MVGLSSSWLIHHQLKRQQLLNFIVKLKPAKALLPDRMSASLPRPASGEGELTVSWEDQKRINSFSVLASQAEQLAIEMERVTRDLEACRDALRELEMVLDEDEPIR